jgi:hypothetical protein
MAGPADKAPDPKALEVKYTYKDADKDDKTIKDVETAIALHYPAAFTAGLVESGNNAPISKEEYEEQTKEAREKEAEERRLHPDDVKKEEQESPPGKLEQGAAVKPTVQKANPPTNGPKEPQKGAKGEGPKPGKAGEKPHTPPGAEPSLKPPHELALAAASTNDGDLDKWLNNYPHKSSETNEKLSKIKEMAGIAQSFDGQLEKTVADGSGKMAGAKAGLVDFLGKKEVGAIFGHNPYDKVQGGLGSIMRGLSTFQNVVSIVGNVAGKIGMILTVVGLIGMILPPIGAAVSAVARVLNIVGIVCDAIGFALSGILTGLNGVVLAKQIGAGASNEEKAATADMMMTEATSAGGHVLSLAMTYGPGFMKGFKNASKGVISKLFSGIKNKIGTFATKALGPVGNWAKNIGYKMGFGLAEKTGEGLLAKAWKAPGTVLEKVRGTSLVRKINNSEAMQWVEQKAAKLDNNAWLNKIDGYGEKLGESAGEKFAANKHVTKATPKIDSWEKETTKELDEAVAHNAGRNAGNKMAAKIDRDITAARETEINQIADNMDEAGHVPKENMAISKSAGRHADKLERQEEKMVANSEKEAEEKALDQRKEGRIEKEKDANEEEKRVEEWKKDPKDFQAKTDAIEAQREIVEQRLKDKNITDDERKIAEAENEKLRAEADERHLAAMAAANGESPKTLWDLKKQGMEAWEQGHLKDEKGEKLEEGKKDIEEKAGGHGDFEKLEKAEQRENIAEWAKGEAPEVAVYEHVEGMLEDLDEGDEAKDEHEGDEHESEGGDDAKTDDDSDAGDDSPNASFEPNADQAASNGGGEPTNDESKAFEGASASGAGAGSESSAPAPAIAAVAAPAAAAAPAEEDKMAEVPELVYWPKLVSGQDGEFAKAAKDLMRMKQIAYAFQKAQLEARKKALETVATLAKASDDANLKQAKAMDHSISINGTIEEASKSGASANHGSEQATQGQAQQDKGKGNADAKPGETNIDIGEKPSRWHPIKRIWWYVKNWAKKAAAKVFGWIQDQIASLVLRALCGVSMDQMRAYTTALHHRMEFSKLVGQQGQKNAKDTMDATLNTKKESKSASDEALDDAKECDRNVGDANTFVKDVEATEQDLVKQQAAAKAFLADLSAAVAAERAKKKEEQAKKAAEAEKAKAASVAPAAAATATAAAVAVTPAPKTPAPKLAAAPKKKPAKPKKSAEPKEKRVSAVAVSKVQNAASYVTAQTALVMQQLTKSKEEQTSKLRSTFENKKPAQPIIAKLKTGESVLAKATETTRQINAEMGEINSMSPANANVLHEQASKIKGGAKELDMLAKEAQEQMNWSFKLTYDKVKKVREISAYV